MDGDGGNTSVLAALAELAEATSATSNETTSWLSRHGLAISSGGDNSTPFRLTGQSVSP